MEKKNLEEALKEYIDWTGYRDIKTDKLIDKEEQPKPIKLAMELKEYFDKWK